MPMVETNLETVRNPTTFSRGRMSEDAKYDLMTQENVQSNNEGLQADSSYGQSQPAQAPAKKTRIPLWAIILIVIAAIVVAFFFVVLPMFFVLGVFNGGSLPTSCIAQPGFMCQISSFHGGVLSMKLGQATGTNWNNTGFAFLNMTALANSDNPSYYYTTGISSMESASMDDVNITVRGASYARGTSISGQIWGMYYTNSGGPYYTEIGIVTATET